MMGYGSVGDAPAPQTHREVEVPVKESAARRWLRMLQGKPQPVETILELIPPPPQPARGRVELMTGGRDSAVVKVETTVGMRIIRAVQGE